MLLDVFSRVMIPILVVVGSGYLLRRATGFDLRPLTRVSLYLLSPALIFVSLVQAQIAQGQTLRVIAFSLLLVGAMAALSVAVGRVFGFSQETTSALMLSTMFTNTGNYGLPLALFAFGRTGFDHAVLFFIAQAILTQTLGIYLAGSGRGGWRDGAASLVRMPQLYAVGAALAVRAAGPELVTRSEGVVGDLFRGVSLMADATIPLLLVILGAELARLLGLDELSTKLAVVLGSMPTAVNVSILALEFDLKPRLVSSVVIFSTALSFATLTVLLGALGAGG